MHPLILLLWWLPCCLAAVFDLSSLEWTLLNQNGSIAVPGALPSQAHLDLIRAGIITQPLLGLNDFTERWVLIDNWTYTADLAPVLASGLDAADQILLAFYGLDTIANITLAGQPIAWVNNEFRQYVFDVSFLSSVTAGNLTVAFESAYYYGLNVSTRPDAEDTLASFFGSEIPVTRPYMRKTASDFGWDWCPAFVPSGIIKPAYLISLSNSTSATGTGDPHPWDKTSRLPPDETADWVVNVTLALRSSSAFDALSITLAFTELNITSPVFSLDPLAVTGDSPSWVTVLWQIPDAISQRWYPHNLGIPTLYNLTISLGLVDSAEDITTTVRTGLRTTEQVRWVLESAVQSGQNMLRAWVYQPDSEEEGGLGILLEFIFSDALYPINDFLLESIEPEVARMSDASTSTPAMCIPCTDYSTTNGMLSLDPYLLRLANSTPGEIYGNTERYNYDASQAFNYSTFPVSRFHSMPSFYSWEEVLTSPDDFSFNSTVVASRDHRPPPGNLSFPNPNAPQGQGQMTQGVDLWLPTPSTSVSNQIFAQWCWSTQIFQSMAMMSQISWARTNDIWQGDNQTLEIVVTSDRWETVEGSAQLTWYDWLGNMLNTARTISWSRPSTTSLISQAMGLDSILPVGRNATDVWMLLNLTAQVGNKTVTNEQYVSECVHPGVVGKCVTIVDPQLQMITSEDLTFTLSALGGVAPWTWLDHPAGTVSVFVDNTTGLPCNGFYLVPGIDRTLKFILNQNLSTNASPDPDDFVLRSLWNNTHAT
ncbi:glycoside hydrolase family 2 protein [Mycena latifolia]|nr:glycoside hydrolase family 2 protein [Mycena latifolia]